MEKLMKTQIKRALGTAGLLTVLAAALVGAGTSDAHAYVGYCGAPDHNHGSTLHGGLGIYNDFQDWFGSEPPHTMEGRYYIGTAYCGYY